MSSIWLQLEKDYKYSDNIQKPVSKSALKLWILSFQHKKRSTLIILAYNPRHARVFTNYTSTQKHVC